MFGKFKKYFVPHEANDHRPHILRPRAVAFVCLVALGIEALFIFGSAYIIPRVRLFGIIIVSALVDGTNAARTTAGLPALHESALLDAAAQAKANDMVANNYFAHTSPAGVTPWYWFVNAGYSFSAAGENLAVDFSDSADVTTAWLNSPEHRANIMNTGYTDIGMATAQGTFDGHPAIYVVELFGRPSAAAPLAFVTTVHAAPATVTAPVAPTATQTAQTAPSAIVLATTSEPEPALETTNTVAPAAASQLNPIQAAAADPRRTVDYIYFGIALFFALALALNVFVKIHIQHSQVILGGMLIILIVGLLIVLNQHFGAGGVVVG